MLIEFAGGAGSPVGSSASRAASSRWPYASSGIPDELFIRGDVPMTKQEVRAVALAKLRLTATDTVGRRRRHGERVDRGGARRASGVGMGG